MQNIKGMILKCIRTYREKKNMKKKKKMGPFKTKNCKLLTFPLAIFCKAVFPKVYFHIQHELRMMYTKEKLSL